MQASGVRRVSSESTRLHPGFMIRTALHAAVASAILVSAAAAQNAGSAPPGAAPARPSGVTRDERGRATVRAVRLAVPLRFDGRLDDDVYRSVPPIDGFLQQVPQEGAPATEATEMWVLFDEDTLYIGARCLDSQPDRISANELRRDSNGIFQNDNFGVVLDTFLDQRNAYYFQTNAIGALRDASVTEGVNNSNWSTVWDVRTARSDEGYTLEMAIPFKSLRYRGAGPQTWGINVRRVVAWKNESSMLSRVPASFGNSWTQMSVAGTLVGLETPAQALNLELKPYAVSSLTTDRTSRVPFSNDGKASAGFDVKYGLTRGLTADLTVNTDFAQVEEDLQQVNLTRFDLFYPDKRDFFLEGQGIFDFGGQASFNARNSTVPILFFSRRIGLSNGQAVPVVAGGRVTGRAGAYEVGGLVLTTAAKASAGADETTFSAVRVRRNILRRSSIGFITTGRSPGASGGDARTTAGMDAYFRVTDNVQANLYWARAPAAGLTGDDASYRARFLYGGDRYGFEADRVVVGPAFNPEVGFVRRGNAAMNFASARFSPRLRQSRLVRRLRWEAELDYITDAAGDTLEDRALAGRFGVEFNSSDDVQVTVTRQFERLPADFTIARGVVVPAGPYSYQFVGVNYSLAQQRMVSGSASASHGSFYDGTRTTAVYNGRVGLSAHVAIEPNLTFNWVRLPAGDFDARLVGLRFVLSPTARLGFSSLTQVNPGAHTLTSSVRMRWEYAPGSDLYVVYSDGRDTSAGGFPALQNRSFAVKATRLFRF
jgi:hypothetical protein